MAYNKANAERKWRFWKEAQENKLRSLGVDDLLSDMYSGGFYPYSTLEEHWAYWSRYIYINRYMKAPKPVYNKLIKFVKDKDYFVITTNIDYY